jgi:hypothetical protein
MYETLHFCVESEDLTTVSMKSTVFSEVKSCSRLEARPCSEGTYCLRPENQAENGPTHKIIFIILFLFSSLEVFPYIRNGFSTVAFYRHFFLSISRPLFSSSCLFLLPSLFFLLLGACTCQNNLLNYRIVERW